MSTRSLAGDTTPARPVDDFAAGATYLSDIDGGSDFVLVDGVLAILLVVAYALANGWTAWSRR